MQAYYRSALGQDGGGPVSPDERQALQRAMIDYGALQPSPVQKPLDPASSNATPDRTIVRNSVAREPASLAAHNLMSPPSNVPNGNGYTSANIPSYPQWNPSPQQHSIQAQGMAQSQLQQQPLGLGDGFDEDFDFDFANVDMEALGYATQDFWGSFPGEVGSYI